MTDLIDTSEPNDTRPSVIILGGGPAGLAAAHKLSRDHAARVQLFEQRDEVGGNAGSFLLEGVWCDHGSHRLHAVVEPRIMDDVRQLLGDDLLWRPRHGRILLQGSWIHFPLKPVDLALRMPKKLSFSLAVDALAKVVPRSAPEEENFATVLRHGLGPTMCDSFYYPYVTKLWGLSPEQLAVTLAHRRVSGSSPYKILAKIARQIPGLGSRKASGFYYPRQGFGMLSEALRRSAQQHGAGIRLGTSVQSIHRDGQQVTGISFEHKGEVHHAESDAIWSTLPITRVVQMLSPAAPDNVLAAASNIRFRGMILIYLVLDSPQFTEYDAHYFPELSVPISRMSEPKNYSGAVEPSDKTVLCAELPCDPDSEYWMMSDEQLGAAYVKWLHQMDLPVTVKVLNTYTRRLKYAYPVYDREFERHFRVVDEWLSGLNGFLSYGRQGLFAHDNTHHAMTMAYAAVDCLAPSGDFNKARWSEYRREFESHVVED